MRPDEGEKERKRSRGTHHALSRRAKSVCRLVVGASSFRGAGSSVASSVGSSVASSSAPALAATFSRRKLRTDVGEPSSRRLLFQRLPEREEEDIVSVFFLFGV